MDLLYSKIFSKSDETIKPKVDDIENPPLEEIVTVIEVDGHIFQLDEEATEDEKYKWYEMVDGEKVKRNNTDPSLTPDGLPSTESQLKLIEERDNELIKELSEEELVKKHNKDMLMRIRCIALDAMGKNILSDPRRLQHRERKDFVRRVEELLILSEEEIKKMFGDICHETIFLPGSDYSSYVVYDA